MTIDERRVTTALKAYSSSLSLDDDDLERMYGRLEESLQPTPVGGGRRRGWDWAVAACAVTALVLAVTALWRTRNDETLPAAPVTSSVTRADLTGVWMLDTPDSNGWLWHFTADGRLAQTKDPSSYPRLARRLQPYTLEPDGVLSVPAATGPCRSRIQQSTDGRMLLTAIGDCASWGDGDVWPFVRVSPVTAAGAAPSPNPRYRHARGLPRDMNEIRGTWLLRGTGTIIVVNSGSPTGGEYLLDPEGDGNVQHYQRGTVELQREGVLVLRPSTMPSCDTTFSRVAATGATLELELADSSLW